MAQPYQLPELIVTRLATVGYPVLQVANLAGVKEFAQVAPAINVLPFSLAVIDDGDATSVRETVLILAVTRFSNDGSGAGTRVAAGAMLAAVHTLLKAWQPTTAHSPLTCESPPAFQSTDAYGYYPLQYSSIYSI